MLLVPFWFQNLKNLQLLPGMVEVKIQAYYYQRVLETKLQIKGNQNTRSLGIFYSAMTTYVGFKLFDEGKTMGLSAFGTDKYLNDFDDIIYKYENSFKINQKYFLT